MIKKTSITKLMSSADADNTAAFEIQCGDTTETVEVKTTMTIDEMTTFIDRVVNGCIDTDGNYHPEYLIPIFEITVLQMMTNVPVIEKTINSSDSDGESAEKAVAIKVVDIDKTYELCEALSIAENVSDKNFYKLYQRLSIMVRERAEFEKQRILAGEREQLRKTRDELETGLALINAIGEQLLKVVEENGIADAAAALINKTNGITNEELLDAAIKYSENS